MGLEDDPDDNANARRVLHDVVFVAQQPTDETELAATTANDPHSVISSSLPPEQYPFPGDGSPADTNIDDDASARNFDARSNILSPAMVVPPTPTLTTTYRLGILTRGSINCRTSYSCPRRNVYACFPS